MATKMKGFFKGLRHISHIFEDDKEEEMQIGFPTDVKHVAHIGWDGPSQVDSSPSWMKEFKASNGHQSAPLDSSGKTIEDPEIKWVSEDSKKGNRATDSSGRDLPKVPRSSRRQQPSGNNNSNESPKKKESSAKSRYSRRNHYKDSSEGGIKLGHDESGRPDSPSRAHPDLAKKSRRKKSKESDGGGSTKSRSKDTDGGSTRSKSKDSVSEECGSTKSRPIPTCGASAYLDAGSHTGSMDEEKERRVIS